MKSGGPWNLRGLRPETREAARDAARRSGMSVGEWLNSVIQQGGNDDDYGEPMQAADYDDDYEDDWRPRPRRRRPDREAALAREEIGEVNARLDRLTHQLERMSRSSAARLTGAPAPARGRAPPLPRSRSGNRSAPEGPVTVDAAVAEIAERQRMLYGDSAPLASPPEAPMTPPAYSPSIQAPPEPAVDIGNLDDQLRYITRQIESLRPSNELQQVIAGFRRDLADIRQQLTGALPRRDVQSLENEVDSLAERLDHSRNNGADRNALAGLESRLDEVRGALHGLTPAESLAGFDDALRGLSQKVDRIIAREDPATLQQLETAIGGLRGIVSHVASNDTLNKVAEDVRLLAAKVDEIASNAASGHAVAALEGRLDTLTSALTASSEAGNAVPRELEKMLAGLIEKLEWVQLTHTDHAALGQLEDRLAQLMKRLDTSDAKLVNLGAVERGLADLLVHIDQIRGGGNALAGAAAKPVAVEVIERDVAAIKRSEARTQDSLEAVHGAVEQVVDRLAMIESEIHDGTPEPDMLAQVQAALTQTTQPEPEPAPAPIEPPAAAEPATAAPKPAAPDTASRRSGGTPRQPIDPNLPPDHPLEPGSAAGPRPMPSAADRIAASEAAVGLSKPPVIDEPGERPNFIAAARRAAQAAITAPPADRPTRAEPAATRKAAKPGRLRRLIVIAGAMLIMIGVVHIALHMFQDHSSPDTAAVTPPPSEQTPAPVPENDSDKDAPQSGPLVLPVPGAVPDATPSQPPSAPQAVAPGIAPAAPPSANPPAAPQPADPARQSALPANDITGALPRRVPPPPPPMLTAPPAPMEALAAPAGVFETLPATIGGPKLRAAAVAGDAAAEFEVATRFGDGHGVPPNDEEAARWFDRAAKQGLAPAQFRLGGLYEKGVGVKKDLAMARDLYAAAASKGNGKAMHNLAVLYAEGIDGPADYRTAAHWFRKAADCGITDSQYNLAILYARGIGVEQNYAEAYKWFALGANAGDSEAAAKRDEVASHLDPQALAGAQAAVKTWTAMAQPGDSVTVKAPPGGWDLAAQAAKPKPKSSTGSSTGKTSALDIKQN
jgi:localization factor PodJL